MICGGHNHTVQQEEEWEVRRGLIVVGRIQVLNMVLGRVLDEAGLCGRADDVCNLACHSHSEP